MLKDYQKLKGAPKRKPIKVEEQGIPSLYTMLKPKPIIPQPTTAGTNEMMPDIEELADIVAPQGLSPQDTPQAAPQVGPSPMPTST